MQLKPRLRQVLLAVLTAVLMYFASQLTIYLMRKLMPEDEIEQGIDSSLADVQEESGV